MFDCQKIIKKTNTHLKTTTKKTKLNKINNHQTKQFLNSKIPIFYFHQDN